MKPFTYAVGHRWNEDDEDSAIGCHALGQQVFHGTIEDAEEYLRYVKRKTKLANGNVQMHNWRIYKLVEVV